MVEGPPVPPLGGRANQGASFKPVEQPNKGDASDIFRRQQFDVNGIATELENAGFHTLAEKMRQPKPSDEEIRQRQLQDHKAWLAEREAHATGRPPEIEAPEDRTQNIDLNSLADLAEQQQQHTVAVVLRRFAKKSSRT